jgi:hypothetical protein
MKVAWLGLSLLASSLFAQLPTVHQPADDVPHGQIIPLWDAES